MNKVQAFYQASEIRRWLRSTANATERSLSTARILDRKAYLKGRLVAMRSVERKLERLMEAMLGDCTLPDSRLSNRRMRRSLGTQERKAMIKRDQDTLTQMMVEALPDRDKDRIAVFVKRRFLNTPGNKSPEYISEATFKGWVSKFKSWDAGRAGSSGGCNGRVVRGVGGLGD